MPSEKAKSRMVCEGFSELMALTSFPALMLYKAICRPVGSADVSTDGEAACPDGGSVV